MGLGGRPRSELDPHTRCGTSGKSSPSRATVSWPVWMDSGPVYTVSAEWAEPVEMCSVGCRSFQHRACFLGPWINRLSLSQQMVCVPHSLSLALSRGLTLLLPHPLTCFPPWPGASSLCSPPANQQTRICPKRDKPYIPSVPPNIRGSKMPSGKGVGRGLPDPPTHRSSPFPQLTVC